MAAGSILHKITVSTASISSFDPLGVRAFTLSNSTNSLVYDIYQEFTKYNKANGTITFVVSGAALAAADRVVVNYHKQPTAVTRGDFEAGKTQEGSNAILRWIYRN